MTDQQSSLHWAWTDIGGLSLEAITEIRKLVRFAGSDEEATRIMNDKLAFSIWMDRQRKDRMYDEAIQANEKFRGKVVDGIINAEKGCWSGTMEFIRSLDLEDHPRIPKTTFYATKTMTFEVPDFGESASPDESEALDWFTDNVESELDWYHADVDSIERVD